MYDDPADTAAQSDRPESGPPEPDASEPDAPELDAPEPDAFEPDALEPGLAEGPSSSTRALNRPWRRPADWRGSALIGVLTLLLGFAIAIQLHSTSSGDALAGARPADLISILDDQNSESARLRARIAQLQGTLQRLRDAGTNGPAARQEAEAQADGLSILTGTVAATGPGVVVTITDPAHGLKAEDLLDVVEELRGAGAEAIQFGPVRVGLSSAFRDDNGQVDLDGVGLTAPYTVLAIGPATTMQTALDIPGGVAAVVRNAGGTATIARRATLDITVVRTLAKDKYARPSK